MFSRIFIIAIALAIGTRVHGLSASDTLACRRLTDMVGQPQPADWTEAAALCAEAGSHPQLKCLTRQSMALLLIRESRFSEAWTQLAEIDPLLSSTSAGVHLQQAKLKLWLLVQARNGKAEEQLKAIVTQVLKTDTKEHDRQDACLFLGKICQLLHSCEVSCGVSKATIERAKQLLEAQSSKPSVTAFQRGWTVSQEWDQKMRPLLAQCTDKAAAQVVAEELERNAVDTKKQYSEVQAQHKQEKIRESELDIKRLAAQRHQKEVIVEMRRPTPGMPRKPARNHVGSPGKNATTAERRQYERELDEAIEEYEEEMKAYPAKLKAWQEKDQIRRELLQKNKMSADDALSTAEMNVNAQEDIVKGLHDQLQSHRETIDGLNYQLAAARALASRTNDSPPSFDLLQKPAYYPTFDFPQEAIRLSKMVSKPVPAKN